MSDQAETSEPLQQTSFIDTPTPVKPLTLTELDMLRHWAKGMDNKDISNFRSVSPRTTEVHTSHIYEKLGVEGKIPAVKEALQRGILDPKQIGKERFDERLFYKLSPNALGLLNAMEELSQNKNSRMTEKELASHLNVSLPEVGKLMREISNTLRIKTKLQAFTQYLPFKEAGGVQYSGNPPEGYTQLTFKPEEGTFIIQEQTLLDRFKVTTREKEVLELLVGGFTGGQIAEILKMSPKTTEVHIGNIKNKLGVSGPSENIVKKLVEAGMVSSEKVGEHIHPVMTGENLPPSPRQEQVIKLKAEGQGGKTLTSAQVAQELGISRKTVEAHVHEGSKRMGLQTGRQAAILELAKSNK